MKFKTPHRVPPHSKLRLAHVPTDATGRFHSKQEADTELERHRKKLDERQELLAASAQQAVLVVLQGMDTGGKDGTIRHIFTGVNPQGCDVTPFKVPTPLEKRHDFLWRAQAAVPPKGMIGIFNRSHYEDVLVVRVHKQISDKEAHRRMDEIVEWEQMLAANGVVVLKFFLHIGYEEQTRRLAERLADPSKHWKISQADFAERKFWPDYQRAYEDVLRRTSRKDAPWFVIPSDHKWYRNIAISQILVEALEGMKMKYPEPAFDISKIQLD
ncbi:MAG: polyphosphate kinase 2 family protein [Acidobacteriaceae bacterium]